MSNPTSYRPEIDGLRAIAVGSVVIFHFFPAALPGGFVGVDVFFVISGYLITGIILRHLAEGSFSFSDFYARRVRRIFPALIAMLAAVGVAGWFLLLPSELAELGRHTVGAATFTSNFLLWSETGYFDANSHTKLLLHLWSLAIEEQFYVLWPAALVLLHRFRIKAVWAILILGLVSLSLCLALTRTDPTQAFYAPWSRAWELLAGAMLVVVEKRLWTGPWRQAAGLIGLGLIATSLFVLQGTDPYPGWRAVFPVLGSTLIIAAGSSTVSGKILSLSPLPAIGLISYPLYLWHWPLVVFPFIVLGAEPSMEFRTGAIVLSIVLATATYLWIERPIRHKVPARLISAGMAALAGMGLIAVITGGIPSRPPIAPFVDLEARYLESTAWPYKENENCLNRFPSPDRKEGWWFCMLEENRPPTIFLMGNSFANHLYPGLAENPLMAGENVLQFGTCDPAMGIRYSLYDTAHPCYGDKRDRLEDFSSQIVKNNPEIRIVILSSLWPYFKANGDIYNPHEHDEVNGVYSTVGKSGPENSYEAFMGGLERRVSFLVDQGVVPVIALSTPTFPYNPDTCFASRPLRSATNSCSVSLAEEMKRQQTFRAGVKSIAARFPTVLTFDPLPVICHDGLCNMIKDGRPMLRDVGHLSKEGSEIVGASLTKFLLENQAIFRRQITRLNQ